MLATSASMEDAASEEAASEASELARGGEAVGPVEPRERSSERTTREVEGAEEDPRGATRRDENRAEARERKRAAEPRSAAGGGVDARVRSMAGARAGRVEPEPRAEGCARYPLIITEQRAKLESAVGVGRAHD
jgi:ribosome assembly protein YihI (activator of Der GTPase)